MASGSATNRNSRTPARASVLEVEALEDVDPALDQQQRVHRLRVGGLPTVGRGLDLVGLGVRAGGEHAALRQQLAPPTGRDRRRGAAPARRDRASARGSRCAPAPRRPRPPRRRCSRLDRAQLVRAHRLAGRQRLDAAVAGHVVEHAAPPDRRDLGGVALERAEVAEVGAGRAAVPAVVVADRHVRVGVDVRAGVGRAHHELAHVAQAGVVGRAPRLVAGRADALRRAVGDDLERRVPGEQRHLREPLAGEPVHAAGPDQPGQLAHLGRARWPRARATARARAAPRRAPAPAGDRG